MKHAGDKRQREFYSGRHLARAALLKAGIGPTAILRGPLGEPLWPGSVSGSITHDQSLGAAVVCTDPDIAGIGVDLIEDPWQVGEPLADMILHPEEASLLRIRFPLLPATGVAFSLKESVVKAVSVHLGRYMDLLEISIGGHGEALAAHVKGLQAPLPVMVYAAEFGLFTCCLRPSGAALEHQKLTFESRLRTS